MLQLKNSTPFKATIAVLPDEHGIETLYLAVKATFTLGPGVEVAEKQQDIVFADEYLGEPGGSSLKYASDVHLAKPSTDVLLIGQAQAPDRRTVSTLDVSLSVGAVRKTVRVFGDRQSTGGLVPPLMTAPTPYETMPLVYERAFGGVHQADTDSGGALFEPRNPVGCGFAGKRIRKELKGLPLPNLEDPSHVIAEPGDRQAPACFGFVAPSWEPRKSFAGTYDEAWMKGRAPFLPEDFDRRFFNAASPDLVCAGHLKGGEPVEVRNASPTGRLRFRLPVCCLGATVRVDGRLEQLLVNLETVLIDADQSRLSMLWRASLRCDKGALKVDQVGVAVLGLETDRAVV